MGTETEETVDYRACDCIVLPDGSTSLINLTRAVRMQKRLMKGQGRIQGGDERGALP